MGLKLAYRGQPIDMENAPTTEALMEQFVRRSRVPLDLIKQHPHGHLYPDPQPFAEAKEADWPHRLQLGDATMLDQLQQVAARLTSPAAVSSAGGGVAGGRRRHRVAAGESARACGLQLRCASLAGAAAQAPFNPAYVNPADALRLGLEDGGAIEIESSVGRVNAVLQFAPDVREGVVSMAHGFDPLAGAG